MTVAQCQRHHPRDFGHVCHRRHCFIRDKIAAGPKPKHRIEQNLNIRAARGDHQINARNAIFKTRPRQTLDVLYADIKRHGTCQRNNNQGKAESPVGKRPAQQCQHLCIHSRASPVTGSLVRSCI